MSIYDDDWLTLTLPVKLNKMLFEKPVRANILRVSRFVRSLMLQDDRQTDEWVYGMKYDR